GMPVSLGSNGGLHPSLSAPLHGLAFASATHDEERRAEHEQQHREQNPQRHVGSREGQQRGLLYRYDVVILGDRTRGQPAGGGSGRRRRRLAGGRYTTCCRTHSCITMAAAAAALIDRVEPNWRISTWASAAARAASVSP